MSLCAARGLRLVGWAALGVRLYANCWKMPGRVDREDPVAELLAESRRTEMALFLCEDAFFVLESLRDERIEC